ncbi:MAG: LPS export ABC transporter permease LptF [Gallionellaceae bacterium]|nr:LPS export ABC transporter permease LptF [Gallionellaceae bacterium]
MLNSTWFSLIKLHLYNMPDYPQIPEQKSKSPRAPILRRGLLHKGLFHRTLVREFSGMGLFIFAILLGIVVFTQLVRLLSDAVNGTLAADGVLALLGFSALNYLPVLLSLSLFLSVLLTLTRSYRDSEMVVWFCSGLGLTRWIGPVLWYALPVIGLIALLSLFLSPWALSQADEFKRRLKSRDEVANATPGVFRESQQADRVLFVENLEMEKTRVGNIFVQSIQHGKNGIMVAKEGLQETAPNGDRFLVLLNGTRYEGVPGQYDYKVVEFERYALRLEEVEIKQDYVWPKSLPTLYLLQNRSNWNMSELEWRIGLPLSALILTLLAIPLSFVNPRTGRSLNLIMALVIYMLYNNLISVTNTWVGQGKISPTFGLLGIHTLMLGLMLLLFYIRYSMQPWQRLFRIGK